MKICLLTRRFALDSGGIGRVSTEIRDGLLRLGHDVFTVSTDKEDLVSYFKYVFWGIKAKIPKHCDVYHAITPMESIWIPKKRSVATILDIIPITNPDKHGARMGGNWVKYSIGKECFAIGCVCASRCAKVACISGHVRDEFASYFGAKPEVIRLGIRNDFEPQLKREGVLRLGYLGQVDRRKRVDTLVDSFMHSKLDAELWIAGKGMDEDELRAKSIFDSRISFLGFIPDDALPSFYNQLDVLIFPTSIEGYGLPPIEAMACKKPTIVLRDARIPSDVKSRCAVVDSLDIVFSNHNMLGDTMGSVNLDGNYQFAKSHSWEKCVNQYVKLYEEILG